MEPRLSSKNVTIDDKVYQLNKLDARSGCWLFSFISAKAGDGPILSGLGNCTRAEFDETQAMLLKSVLHIDVKDGNTFPTPIFSNGLLIGHVNEDAGLAYKLTVEALFFNLQPFLVVVGSNSQK